MSMEYVVLLCIIALCEILNSCSDKSLLFYKNAILSLDLYCMVLPKVYGAFTLR